MCWWWSTSGWPYSEDCLGGLEEQKEKKKSLTEALLFWSGSQTDTCIWASRFLLLAHNPEHNTIIHFSTMLCRNHSLLLNLRQSLKMHSIWLLIYEFNPGSSLAWVCKRVHIQASAEEPRIICLGDIWCYCHWQGYRLVVLVALWFWQDSHIQARICGMKLPA